MEIVSATASGISVSGAIVKVGSFFSKHTTRRQVKLGQTQLSICMAILIENKNIMDEDDLLRLLGRYDGLIADSAYFKDKRNFLETPTTLRKAHKFSGKTEELLFDARNISDAAKRIQKFLDISKRPDNVLPNRGRPLSPPVMNDELEDVFGTAASRKGSKDDKTGRAHPSIPPGLPIRLELNPGRRSSASWRERLIPSRRRDSRVAGPSTEIPDPFLTRAELDVPQQTMMDLCRSPSISSSVFWNGHIDVDSGI